MKTQDHDPNKYYVNTERQDARMHRLVALRMRNAILSHALYTKGQKDEDTGEWGPFDIVDPTEEAAMLITDLRFFGFIPEAEESGTDSQGRKDGK